MRCISPGGSKDSARLVPGTFPIRVPHRTNYTDRCPRLPDKFEIHEWAIMKKILPGPCGPKAFERIFSTHGAGAFRGFKAAIYRHKIESAWFTFRARALKEIAIRWCEEHRVSWR
jgi:hypothetical protein